MSAHTPTPWYAEGLLIHTAIVDKKTLLIARVLGRESDPEGMEAARADIAFIVRACNAHDDLLAMLKVAAPEFCSMRCPSVWRTAEYEGQPHVAECNSIRAAIAKAEER